MVCLLSAFRYRLRLAYLGQGLFDNFQPGTWLVGVLTQVPAELPPARLAQEQAHNVAGNVGKVHAPVQLLLNKRKHRPQRLVDRKSTRLNSSHVRNSYAGFCWKEKKHESETTRR